MIKEYRTSLFKLFTIHNNSCSGGVLDVFQTYPHLNDDDYIKLAIQKRYENNYMWYEKEFKRLTNKMGELWKHGLNNTILARWNMRAFLYRNKCFFYK